MKFFANDGTEIIPTSPVYKVIIYNKDKDWSRMLDDFVREACVYELIMFRRNDDLWYIPYDYVLAKHDEDIYFEYILDDLYHYVPLIDERNTVCEYTYNFDITVVNEDEFYNWNFVRQNGMSPDEYDEMMLKYYFNSDDSDDSVISDEEWERKREEWDQQCKECEEERERERVKHCE